MDAEVGTMQSHSLNAPTMRDPLTRIFGFVPAPSALRLCSHLTVEAWDHAVYLEVGLPCPYVAAASQQALPSHIGNARVQHSNDDAHTRSGDELEDVDPLARTAPVSATNLHHVKRWQGDGLGYVLNVTRTSTVKQLLLAGGSSTTDEGLALDLNVSPAITGIAFQSLPNFTRVGEGRALSGCRYLAHFEMTDLPKLTAIGPDFLSRCINLETATFRNLPTLYAFGDSFLCESGLTHFTLSELPSLTNLGSGVLSSCPNLEHVTLCHLALLKSIESYFLHDCGRLETLKMKHLPELEHVGEWWMGRPPGLAVALDLVEFEELPKFAHLGAEHSGRPGSTYLFLSDGVEGCGDSCHQKLRDWVTLQQGRRYQS